MSYGGPVFLAFRIMWLLAHPLHIPLPPETTGGAMEGDGRGAESYDLNYLRTKYSWAIRLPW
jgi:hypothetical protein